MKLTAEMISSLSKEAQAIGSKHCPIKMRTLHVQVSFDGMKHFNEAFIKEGERKNPLLARQVNLSLDELVEYEKYLLYQRVLIVNNQCTNFRRVKRLAMPCFIERVLTDVGRVQIRNKALDIWPVTGLKAEEVISFEEAVAISDKIESFYDDLAVVVGAMPADMTGNPETMTVALIQDYVIGMSDTQDPLVEYIVFALQAILQETEYNNLYFMQYDDVKTIESNMSVLGRSLVR